MYLTAFLFYAKKTDIKKIKMLWNLNVGAKVNCGAMLSTLPIFFWYTVTRGALYFNSTFFFLFQCLRQGD